jgi:ribosomal protein S24E
METKILTHKKNPLLNREEFVIELKTDTNPSFEDVKDSMKKDKNLIVVKKLDGNFGSHSFLADVFVYDSEDARKKVEFIPMRIRKKLEEAAKTRAVTA